jgi:hypothetical protein
MVAVIAYQSLNSNASTEHNLDATTSQHFLRQAQRTLSSLYPEGSGALKYPTNPDIDPHEAIQGPAQLLPVAGSSFMDVEEPNKKRKRAQTDDETDAAYNEARLRTLGMVEGKSRQIYQQTYREFGEQCDLVVFGELDSDHPDWRSLTASSGKRVHVSSFPKACNCFSLHSSGASLKVQPLADGEGWCAARCNGVLAVFVHVPNSLATKKDEAVKFYNTIRSKLLVTDGGGVIDVVMGDTNQPSEMFSPGVISKGLAGDFKDGHGSGTITASDTWSQGGVTHKGTNSVDNKKFDVAVYNTATVAKISVRYITQLSFSGGKAAAYTDHMGILVKVEKK